MAKLMRTHEILTASFGSFAFCMFGSLLLLLGVIVTKVRGGQLVNVLLGQEASLSLLRQSEENIFDTVNLALSNDVLGRSVVFILWMFVGLVVFALLNGLQRATGQINNIKRQTKMVNHNNTSYTRMLMADLAFRLGMALAWTTFLFICLQLLLPFFVAAVYILFGGAPDGRDWLIAAVAISTVFLGLHAHVMFARLFFGRVRLFNSKL